MVPEMTRSISRLRFISSALSNFDLARLCGEAHFRQSMRCGENCGSDICRRYSRSGVLRTRALNYLAVISLLESRAARTAAAAADTREGFDAELVKCRQLLDDANRDSSDAEQLSTSLSAYPVAKFQVFLTRAKVLQALAMVDVEQAKQLRINGIIDQAATQESAGKAKVRDAIAKLDEALEVIELPRAMTVGRRRASRLLLAICAGVRFVGGALHRSRALREAIEIAEKRRSRTFLDQLRAGGVDLYATLPSGSAALVRREKELGDQYYTLLAKIPRKSGQATCRSVAGSKGAMGRGA